jgi:hypothetical protein
MTAAPSALLRQFRVGLVQFLIPYPVYGFPCTPFPQLAFDSEPLS